MRDEELFRQAEELVGKWQVDAVRKGASYTSRWWRYFFPIGIAAGAVYAAYLGINAMFGEDEAEGYIHASGLGKRGTRFEEDLEAALFHTDREFDPRTEAIMAGGTYFHEVMQDIFGQAGATSEKEVVDEQLGIVGHIDVVLEGGIPVEVKTISSTGFERLSKPLDAHTSQLNFYIHAQQSQYGYVVYLDGQDISRRKVFRVGYQPGRLIADVEAARSAMLENPEQMSRLSINWLTQQYQMSPAYLRGLRHSSGSASSFESMHSSPEFPGGRVASIVQASKYRPLNKEVGSIPTMGLTIRAHETAIGHRSRGGTAKRAGRTHCNLSRTYRC
jgi:hypothetical protein